jgi:hypothetical protein
MDALCIAQDDDTDKAKEINEMGRIYNNARVTIATANAPSVQSGFLDGIARRDVPLPILLSGGRYGTLWVRERPPLANEPLDSRGWALQEYLLSPHVLYYGTRDLVWKCQKELFEPVLPTRGIYSADWFPQANIELPATIFDVSSHYVAPIDTFWNWVQSSFSSRNLSLFEDRFCALGGIAEFVGKFSKNFAWICPLPNGKSLDNILFRSL